MSQLPNTSAGDPPDLAAWGLHCFCPQARRTPHALVREGTNGRLLYQARHGVTLDEPQSGGIDVADTTLDRLVEYGLLRRDGDTVQTTFPLVGRQVTDPLRTALRRVGVGLAERLASTVRDITTNLAAQGLASSTYAIVFGHALDGLVWGELRSRSALPATGLTHERPWWNGAFWAMSPPRPGAAGTNFVTLGERTLVLVWTEETVGGLNALPHDEVLRDGGIPTIGTGNSLDVLAETMAGVVVDSITGDEGRAARRLVPTDDLAIATVIVAHELIWETTDALVAAGLVGLPPVLSGARVTPAALRDLILIRVDQHPA